LNIRKANVIIWFLSSLENQTLNPLESTGNYSATSNNMKLVHWPLIGGLLHSRVKIVQTHTNWIILQRFNCWN